MFFLSLRWSATAIALTALRFIDGTPKANAYSAQAFPQTENNCHRSGGIHTAVDVAIIGGGASGMYTATRLHQLNKTVAVIECRNQTGGHVDTYKDPSTGSTFDVGVVYYHNTSVVTDFASYLGVPLVAESFQTSNEQNTFVLDFTTGNIIAAQTLAALGNVTAATKQYSDILTRYSYLLSGFHLPSPVPSDFYLPWHDFVQKYDLSGLAFTLDLFNQGWAHILDTPTLYVLKGFGMLLLQSFNNGYELTTASHNNQELYDAAVTKIGSHSVLLNSQVEHVERSEDVVTLSIKRSCGRNLIKAKKLLITVPPLPEVLGSFLQLDDNENDIFGRFTCGHYWNAVLRNTGIPSNVSLFNGNPSSPYLLADQPGILTVVPSGVDNLHRVYFASPDYIPDDEIVDQILEAIGRVSATLGYDSGSASVAYIRSHAPYHCTVTGDDIKAGFYDKLNALQGLKSTWYTGAAFQGHDSGSIWLFIEREILPALLG